MPLTARVLNGSLTKAVLPRGHARFPEEMARPPDPQAARWDLSSSSVHLAVVRPHKELGPALSQTRKSRSLGVSEVSCGVFSLPSAQLRQHPSPRPPPPQETCSRVSLAPAQSLLSTCRSRGGCPATARESPPNRSRRGEAPRRGHVRGRREERTLEREGPRGLQLQGRTRHLRPRHLVTPVATPGTAFAG